MSKARRFQLDELTLRPGTYFNPQTEIMIVVDDSPEIAHEIFDPDELEGVEWLLISEDTPLDEHRRDELIESFQLTHQPGGELLSEDDVEDEDEDEDDEDDELDGVDDLEHGHE
ncbi:MAG TPA: hypothetical protein VGN08_00960 [Solirubrobacteraceae bacterium]|jgi:hypothetical protein